MQKPTYQSSLAAQLAIWAFTDFEQARIALRELSEVVTPDTPFDVRLAYYRYGAFLHNQWQHYTLALEHAHQAIEILEELSDTPVLVETWADLAAIQLNLGDWSAVQDSLDTAREYLNDESAEALRAHVSCREGFLHLHLGNHRQALDALMTAEKDLLGLDDKSPLKDFYIQTLVANGLGDLYEKLGEKDQSLEAYRRVLPIVEQHGLRPRVAWHYLNAGRAELALDNTDQARIFFGNAVQYAAGGDIEAQTLALSNLGILAFLDSDAESAFDLFSQAAAHYEHPVKTADFTNLSKIENWRAGLYIELDDLANAEKHLQQAWEVGEKGHDKHHLGQVSQNMAALKAEQNDYAAAYKWQTRATTQHREYFAETRDRERREIEAGHELERSRQEAQIARLRMAGLQLRALRSQMNPHFLFNALNAIQGLITSNRNDEAESYLAKFAKMMRHTLDYSDMEVVTLEQEVEFLERYLEINRKLRFQDQLKFNISWARDIKPRELEMPTMILQPFVENAIEHGLRPLAKGRLEIYFNLENEGAVLRCTIEDDGVGYNKGKEKQSDQAAYQKHRSRGMDITRERLHLLHQTEKSPAVEPYVLITDLGEESQGARQGTRVIVLLPVLDND